MVKITIKCQFFKIDLKLAKLCFIGYSFILRWFYCIFKTFNKKSKKINELSPKIRTFKKILFTKKNMDIFLVQLCMFITSWKILENSSPFNQIFFNTSLIVSQEHKCISIVVLLVFNFKNASRLYGHPIFSIPVYLW